MSSGNSRIVQGRPPDRRVADVVRQHVACRYDKPIQPHNRQAFDWLQERIGESQAQIVLDAGCGTGLSTRRLAAHHPDGWVVGVDKSLHRLERGARLQAGAIGVQQQRVLWVRADLVDFWRLAHAAGWRVVHQYLLYPNPWPKAGHLRRRWHGHPVFPILVAISDRLTLRTNWRPYAEELNTALEVMGVSARIDSVAAEGLTPFEEKYSASGHALWSLEAEVRPAS